MYNLSTILGHKMLLFARISLLFPSLCLVLTGSLVRMHESQYNILRIILIHIQMTFVVFHGVIEIVLIQSNAV